MEYFFEDIFNPDLDLLTVQIISVLSINPEYLRWDAGLNKLKIVFINELSIENYNLLLTIVNENT